MSETSLGYFADQYGEPTEMGQAQARATAAYGVPRAAYMIHGSTGANAVALGAYKLLCGHLNVLVARGAHHSIINRTLELGGGLTFARSELDRRFEAALPPSPSQITDALVRAQDRGTPVDVVVVTSPAYEGFHARVGELAEIAHEYGTRLHADSAWGPLAGFHPQLPKTPVALGADSASISVHKLGGALSQCALLTWADDEKLDEAMRLAQLQYCTTSPSYLLAASMDQALVELMDGGYEAIARAADIRDALRVRLTDALPALEVLQAPARATPANLDAGRAVDPDAPFDPTRLTVGLAGYDLTGFELSAKLQEHGIIPEKAGVQTVTFFIHIGAGDDLVARVSTAVIDVLSKANPRFERAPMLPDPLQGLDVEPVVNPGAAMTSALTNGESIPISEAAGRVCLELVEAYPPGIPIGVPGFTLTPDAVAYLQAVDNAGGRIVSLKPGAVRVQRLLGD